MSEQYKMIVAQEANIGDQIEPMEVHISKDLNDQMLFAEDDFNPIYQSDVEGTRGVVHSGVLLNLTNPVRSPGYSWAEGTLGVHAREDTTFHSMMPVGKTAVLSWEVQDVYERRGRRYNVVDATVTCEGKVILKRRVYETYFSIE